MLGHGIESGVGVISWEFSDFLDDSNVRSVDLLSLWDPGIVDLFLESSFSWGNLFSVVDEISLDVSMKIFVSLSGSSVVVGNLD